MLNLQYFSVEIDILNNLSLFLINLKKLASCYVQDRMHLLKVSYENAIMIKKDFGIVKLCRLNT